jgi:deoxyribodipyrimidine photo-lyase
MQEVTLFWFRRDLRLQDNAGLYHALKSGYPVVPVFIFDTNILDDLLEKKDKRVDFIHQQLHKLQDMLEKKESSLHVLQGAPEERFKELIKHYKVKAVYTNTDYEPYATDRDKKIATLLKKQGADFHSYKDHVVFEKDEVAKDNGEPYNVFTPYSRKWLATLTDFYLKPYPTAKYYKNFFKQLPKRIPSLKSLGFEETGFKFPSSTLNEDIAKDYDKTRDYPGIKGTSHLGMHLRFGTISIRALVAEAKELNKTFLNELIWREFYQVILWHYPHTATEAFKKEYDNVKWRNNENEFKHWCDGQTGYPIVDAGMRELNETGFMHNRVRMIVASFLTKHLLIDWRWGEAYFAATLLDYDMAANVGNWQWAAGSGCDAAPYFRVFNPELQTKKFDKDLKYIRKWVPEFDSLDYAQPVVEHTAARERFLETYKKALNANR